MLSPIVGMATRAVGGGLAVRPKGPPPHGVKAGQVRGQQGWLWRGCGSQCTRTAPRGQPAGASSAGGLSPRPRAPRQCRAQAVWRAGRFRVGMGPARCPRARCKASARRERRGQRSRCEVALPQENRPKLWSWKALDRDPGRLLAWEGGRREAAPSNKLTDRPARWEVTFYRTAHGQVYAVGRGISGLLRHAECLVSPETRRTAPRSSDFACLSRGG
jgi:hypothetical protein